MKTLLMIFLVAVLSGCAFSPLGNVADGGAVYRYEKTAEGCVVEITSARDVAGGTISIGNDCTLTTKAEAVSGGNALAVIDALVSKL